MKKYLKSTFLLLSCVVAMFICGMSVYAQDASGKLGPSISWNYYEKTGLLKITGKGEMPGSYGDYMDLATKGLDLLVDGELPWLDSNIVGREKIKKVQIGSGITAICDFAFASCTNISSIKIPKTVKTIGRYAISNTAVETLELPSKLNRVAPMAFYYNKKLKSVTIPSSIKIVSRCCFSDCERLRTIKIENGVQEIQEKAFENTALRTITIPSSVTSMGEYVFKGCTSLKCADIQGKVAIEKYCFSGCANLKAVKLGNKVTSIGYRSFEECPSLKAIFVPKSVKTIDDYAFYTIKRYYSGNTLKAKIKYQPVCFYTYPSSEGYNFAKEKSYVSYVDISKSSGMKKWNSAWKNAKK